MVENLNKKIRKKIQLATSFGQSRVIMKGIATSSDVKRCGERGVLRMRNGQLQGKERLSTHCRQNIIKIVVGSGSRFDQQIAIRTKGIGSSTCKKKIKIGSPWVVEEVKNGHGSSAGPVPHMPNTTPV